MRIALNGRFLGAPVTGVQRFCREVSTRLLADGAHALLVPGGVTAAVPVDGARVVRGVLRGHAWEHVELPWRARVAGCDVVLNPSSTGPLWGGPHVLVVHDVTPLTNPEWFSWRLARWYRVALGAAARRAARVLTFSRWTARQLESVVGVAPQRVAVVSQGVEPFERPAAPAVVHQARERLGLPQRFLLGTGAGNRRKNVGFLVRLMERWAGRFPPAPTLVVVGARVPRVHGREEPVSASMHVRLLGYVPDETLHALYTGASAFLFPSLGEGFGRPPLEAMGCGAPVVVSDYGPARELLGDAARIVPLEEGAWVHAVREIVAEDAIRRTLVERGRRVAARFRWDRAAGEVLEGCVGVGG